MRPIICKTRQQIARQLTSLKKLVLFGLDRLTRCGFIKTRNIEELSKAFHNYEPINSFNRLIYLLYLSRLGKIIGL